MDDDDGRSLLLTSLAAMAADVSDDPTDHMPMTCDECGEWCADRAASWVHTHATGHRRFQSATRSATRGDASRQSDHCDHCRGRPGICACSHGCPRGQSQCLQLPEDDNLRELLGQLHRARAASPPRQSASRNQSGHVFQGNSCGVCRECGMCTWRIVGGGRCMNDAGRGAERPRRCGCGSGPSVCSTCGVGPCCAQGTPCRPAPERPSIPTPPPLRQEASGRSQPTRAPSNDSEDEQLAQAIAQSLDSPQGAGQAEVEAVGRTEEENFELQMAMALSLSAAEQQATAYPARQPAVPAASIAPMAAAPRPATTPPPPAASQPQARQNAGAEVPAAPRPATTTPPPPPPVLARTASNPAPPGNIPYDYLARPRGLFLSWFEGRFSGGM